MHWTVVRGVADVALGGEVRFAHENKSVYLPIGLAHRLANPGIEPRQLALFYQHIDPNR